MKVAFVTGAGGWIGLELVRSLLEDDYFVKALIRKDNKDLMSLKEIYNEKLIILKGDLEHIDDWKNEMKGIDCLFHLAAKVHYKPKNHEDIEKMYYINRDCTIKLFDIVSEYKIKKIAFISTVAVYGKHGSNIITKNTNRKPCTAYAISKNEAEIYGMNLFEKYGFPISIIQPVTVYGGNDRGNFKKLYDLAKKGIILTFGRGDNKKTIIYYKDLVEIIKNIGESESTSGKTFICGSESITYNNINKKIKESCKSKFSIIIPNKISRLIIKLLSKSNVKKLENIASNIETLMCDSVYDITESSEFLNSKVHTLFEFWDCEKEYKLKGDNI